MLEERLSGLAIIHCLRVQHVEIDEVIDIFSKSNRKKIYSLKYFTICIYFIRNFFFVYCVILCIIVCVSMKHIQ